MALTLAAWTLASTNVTTERALAFDRYVQLVTAAVTARLDAYETVLRAASGVALREPEVRRAAWNDLATDLAIATRYPDLRVLSLAELAREILRIRADLPIRLNTGYGAHVTSAVARALGVRGLLAKPNTMASLGQAVHDALADA